MKKNINVNISGLLFNIDEDAYQALQNYLDRLKHYFGTDDSAQEIINDIEARISEMLNDKLNERKGVITILDVQEIIKVMGEPGEIEEEADFESPNKNKSRQQSQQSYQTTSGKRKLYRDPDDKVIGGVSSGLAMYFGINVIWIRLAFIALVFFGMSIIVYIVLWIVIPEATTTAQKLEMRGEPINIDNIEKSIREELNNIGDKLNDLKDKHFKKKSNDRNIFERLAGAIISIIGFGFKALLILIGSVFAIVALLVILALIPAFFATGSLFIHTFPGLHFISIFDVSNLLFAGAYGSRMAYVGLMLVIFIPLIAIAFQGIRLIFGYRGKSGMGFTFFIIWITGLILLVISGSQLATDMNSKANIETEIQLNELTNDTLYVRIDEDYFSKLDLDDYMEDDDDISFYADDSFFYYPPKLRVKNIDSNEIAEIHIIKKSRAKNYRKAKQMAEQINYSYRINGDTLTISPLIQVSRSNKWRNQKVEIDLLLPNNKHIQYLEGKYSHPILQEVQDMFRYRLRCDDDETTLILENDTDGFYIDSYGTDINIDSNGVKIRIDQ